MNYYFFFGFSVTNRLRVGEDRTEEPPFQKNTLCAQGVLCALCTQKYIACIKQLDYTLGYIYPQKFWESEGIFNNNLIIISTIISSYKFINIPYYII